jgi:ABC-type sugar transport system ATPase subunit
MVREPAAFAMDEPLSHLDAKLRAYMRAELKRLQKDLGVTTVFVTHDQLEAMTMADRVAVMNFGLLQQHGTPQQLYQQPNNVFVAKFIGEPSMNLLACEMIDEGDQTHLIGESIKLNIPAELRQKVQERSTTQKLLLGVRPQHLNLFHGQANGNDRNVIAGTVYVSEPLGTEVLVRVRVGKELVQVLTGDDVSVDLDEPVTLEIPPDRFFLFDTETEKRII